MAQFRPYPSFVRGAAMKYFSKEFGRSEVNRLWGKTLELYNNNTCKARAIFEYIVSNTYHAVGNRDTCETGATFECIFSNTDNAVMYCYTC